MALNIHQKISIVFTLMLLVSSMYDVLFHLLLGILHVLFESAEFVLDHFVEHLFDIGNRETEIVVFYVLLSLICVSFYRLYCLLPIWRDTFKQKLLQHKNETLEQWQRISLLGKIGWWGFFITAINCWLFLT